MIKVIGRGIENPNRRRHTEVEERARTLSKELGLEGDKEADEAQGVLAGFARNLANAAENRQQIEEALKVLTLKVLKHESEAGRRRGFEIVLRYKSLFEGFMEVMEDADAFFGGKEKVK